MGMFDFGDQFTMFDITPVENQFLLEYMPAADGDYVKVYLYGLMHCYHPSEDMSVKQAASELNLTEDKVLAAYRYWERRGLVRRVADQPPAYRYVNVKQQFFMGTATPRDPEYEAFAESVYAAFGNDRQLHGKEINQCYEWVEDLGLPPEVVLMLIQHMISIKGKGFSIASAQKLAVTLAEQHAVTIDDAEMILGRDKQVWEGSRKLLRRMGKRREPSEDEMNLYLKWLRDWGYSPDAIEVACAETTKGEPTFAYLDGILRGMMQRSGKAATSRGELEKNRQNERRRVEPLKALLAVLGVREVKINEGTLGVYDDMRALYPDEIILMAGRECARRGGTLEDVSGMLDSWQRRGLRTAEDVRAYVERFNRQTRLLKVLYEAWGKTGKPSAGDRTLVQKWQDTWGFDETMIAFCAAYATDADKPMAYLDKVLESFWKQNIHTMDAAAKARQDWQQKASEQPAAAPRRGKTVREQQYEQREYQPSAELPAWMKARLEALGDDA